MTDGIRVTSSRPGDVPEGPAPDSDQFVRPKYSVRRAEGVAVIDVDVPGATEESTEVDGQDGVLTIQADREDTVGEQWRPKLTEIDRASYRLKLELGADQDYDTDSISFSVENGLLRIEVPFA